MPRKMKQIPLRIPQDLAEEAKQRAALEEISVNAFIARAVRVACHPYGGADRETAALRERLARAGMLAESEPAPEVEYTQEELERARREATQGKSLSDYILEERRR